jgi:DNA-binding HxlR family transcriptional regulator
MRSCPRSHCPISYALDMFGDSWSLLVMRDLILNGKRRYQELLESEEGIATNILADRLSRLTRRGFIARRRDPGNKRQFLYTPTPKGLDLIPLMLDMIQWSARHDLATTASRDFLRRLKADRDGLVAGIRQAAGQEEVKASERKGVRS